MSPRKPPPHTAASKQRGPATEPQRYSSTSIPIELHAATLALLDATNPATQRRYTARDVAAWLAETHKVTTTYRSVLRLAANASARGEALLIAAIRAELRDAVAPAKARLLRASRRLDELACKSRSVKDIATATNALTRAFTALATLGGVAAPLAVDLTSGGEKLRVYLPQHAPDAEDEGTPEAP